MKRSAMWVTELAGLVTGAAIAPLFGVGSLLRRARFFHPEGACYDADVCALTTAAEYRPLQQRLCGRALVRLSSAWWRDEKEWPDVLGCAVRFGAVEPPENSPENSPGGTAQDILFATIPYPILTPLGPLFTQVHDFFANTYWGVAPFEIDEVGLVRLRLVPQPLPPQPERSRQNKLDDAVAARAAALDVWIKPLCPAGSWIPLVEIRLLKKRALNQEALHFSPFRTGCGVRPRGFVHAMRRPVYALSQILRPTHAASSGSDG